MQFWWTNSIDVPPRTSVQLAQAMVWQLDEEGKEVDEKRRGNTQLWSGKTNEYWLSQIENGDARTSMKLIR